MTVELPGLDRAVRRLDAWRRSPLAEPSEQGSYKEWTHFCVRLPGDPPGHLLVNLNVTERALTAGVVRVPRLLVLVHADAWVGHVESFDDARVEGAPGEVDLSFGDNAVRWVEGAFELRVRAGAIEAQLRLEPHILPTGTTSVSFGVGHAMQWVAVPRLAASGVLRVAGRTLRLADALAYHDHNWGHFRWGADLSWEWGYVHPLDRRCPWTVVFVRVSDGRRHRTLSQGVLLWNAGTLVRAFQNHEIGAELEGVHGGPRPLTLPGVMGLLVPGAACGVPARMTLRASGLGDELEVAFETQSKARVVVPSDVDAFRTVLLNETSGAARVRGRTRAGAVDFEGSAIVEFVRG